MTMLAATRRLSRSRFFLAVKVTLRDIDINQQFKSGSVEFVQTWLVILRLSLGQPASWQRRNPSSQRIGGVALEARIAAVRHNTQLADEAGIERVAEQRPVADMPLSYPQGWSNSVQQCRQQISHRGLDQLPLPGRVYQVRRAHRQYDEIDAQGV